MAKERISVGNLNLNDAGVGIGTVPVGKLTVAGDVHIATLGAGSTQSVIISPSTSDNGTVTFYGTDGSILTLTNDAVDGSLFIVNDDDGNPVFSISTAGIVSATSFGSIKTSGIVTASKFYGDGSTLTGIIGTGSGVEIQNDGNFIGIAATINFTSPINLSLASGIATAAINSNINLDLDTGNTLQPLQINQTWTAGTGIATAITVNVTDTSSSSSSNLLDLRVGGTSKFSIDKNGTFFITSDGTAIQFNSGDYVIKNSTGTLGFRSGGFGLNTIWSNFCISSSSAGGEDPNIQLYPEADSILAQRKTGARPQTFRIYNTYTSASQYERAYLGWNNNNFIVGTEKGSSIGTARNLYLQTDGTTAVAISTTQNVGIGTTIPTAKLDVQSGDIRVGVDTSSGVILTDANGVQWRLIVNTDGTLATAAV